MFQFLIRCLCKKRMMWLLLIFTACFLTMVSFFLQYGLGLQPCVFCIYESFALFGIVASGLIGVIAPKTPLRYLALSIWIYSSWKGIIFSWKHTLAQSYPSKFMTCDFFIDIPNWIPFSKWLTEKTTTIASSCSPNKFQFLKLSIPQWLVAIFATYIVIAILVLVPNFYKLWSKIYLLIDKFK